MHVASGRSEAIEAARGTRDDLFSKASNIGVPVLAAYGFGVDSTAMIIDLVERGETIHQALSADTSAEKKESIDYLHYFVSRYLTPAGIPHALVKYKPTRFKNFPKYDGLLENCLTNGTLPSISFGRSACSAKYKLAPQNRWTEAWEPAKHIWSVGGKVVKLIGYDAGMQDSRRTALRESDEDDARYVFRYPLREQGYDRAACIRVIEKAGLRVPPKSSCFMCIAMKPAEIRDLEPAMLRLIVLMEARAHGRLRTVEGLWRKTVTGARGGLARPGSMTKFIRDQALLPAEEIDALIAFAPKALVAFLDRCAERPFEERPELREWLDFFHKVGPLGLDIEGRPRLYEEYRDAVEDAA